MKETDNMDHDTHMGVTIAFMLGCGTKCEGLNRGVGGYHIMTFSVKGTNFYLKWIEFIKFTVQK